MSLSDHEWQPHIRDHIKTSTKCKPILRPGGGSVVESLLVVANALCGFWFCNHHDGEEKAGCFTLNVFLVSFDCYFLFCGSSSRCCVLVCSV